MATYTIYARPYTASTGQSAWAAIRAFGGATAAEARNATGAAALDSPAHADTNGSAIADLFEVGRLVNTVKGGSTYTVNQIEFEFDTSTTNIPSNETISDATLSLSWNGGGATANSGTSETLYAYLRSFNDNLAAGYDTAGFIKPADIASLTQVATLAVTASAVTAGAAATFTSTGSALASGLNRAGFTKLAVVPQVTKTGNDFTDNARRIFTSPRSSQVYYTTSTAVPSANKPRIVVNTAAAAAQTVSPAGIASSESFGSPVITSGNAQTLAPPGIASSESFGTATIAYAQVLSPIGITTAQALGLPVISVAAAPQTIVGLGQIPGAEALGTPTVIGGGSTAGGLVVKYRINGAWVSSNGAAVSVRRVTAADSPVQAKPFEVVVVDASSGAVEVRAPQNGNGVSFTVKKVDPSTNPVNVTANSIDGAASFQITAQGRSQDLMSDGASYLLV